MSNHSVRFQCATASPGFNPVIGEVEPGKIYEIPAHLAARFDRAKDWERVETNSGTQTGKSKTKRKA
jgi:hypothetical protein